MSYDFLILPFLCMGRKTIGWCQVEAPRAYQCKQILDLCQCVVFVDLLICVFQFKEWVHIMGRQSDADFKQYSCLSFLIHTNTFLEILGLVTKQRDTAEETEDDTEQSSNDSLSHNSDRK